MMICPKCAQTFNDDGLKFCLMDGTQLVAGESQPTAAFPSAVSVQTMSTTPKRKRKALIWAAAVALILVIGCAIVAALVLFSYRLGSESAKTDRSGGVNSPFSAKPTATPRSTVQSTPVSSSSAEPALAEPNKPNDESEEITPISWTTSAAGFKEETGLTYKFQCPAGGTPSAVWGSDIYTADSSVCTAAVHAGVIMLSKGGDVTIEFRPGRSVYGSTTRNGITTSTFGEYPHSFAVR
ncbi:MAG: LCCL domain-containing protein [Pyrinomonadaceae bacterium]